MDTKYHSNLYKNMLSKTFKETRHKGTLKWVSIYVNLYCLLCFLVIITNMAIIIFLVAIKKFHIATNCVNQFTIFHFSLVYGIFFVNRKVSRTTKLWIYNNKDAV